MHIGMSSILCHCCVCAVCDKSVQSESSSSKQSGKDNYELRCDCPRFRIGRISSFKESCQGEFHFPELMERVNSLLGNAVLPSESQWCECEVGDSGFLQQ